MHKNLERVVGLNGWLLLLLLRAGPFEIRVIPPSRVVSVALQICDDEDVETILESFQQQDQMSDMDHHED